MAFVFEPTWNAAGNHSPVATMTTAQEVEDVVVKICATKVSADVNISALLALFATRSANCSVQKGLHQEELRGAIGSEQHIRIRALVAAGYHVTFHVYISVLLATVGRGKAKRKTALTALSSISYYQGDMRFATDY